MKILYFTKYVRQGASSRLRSYQYFPYFKKKGYDVQVLPLFNEVYLNNTYEGKKNIKNIVFAYLKRFFQLRLVVGPEIIVIEKELFPYFPAWIEQILKGLGIKYIVDYDDAIFHNYDLSSNWWLRTFLSNKIDKVMKNSVVVVAGNDYLKNRALQAGAKKVIKVPTVIEANRYPKKVQLLKQRETIIGWIGSPSTLAYLIPLVPTFEKLAAKYPLKIHIIGAAGKTLNLPQQLVKYIRWEEKTEVLEILNFDIGIMPLDDTPWANGKCAYKLIQYMACGLPVVASPVGMNTKVVKNEYNGFLASTQEEWYSGLENYILDSDLRIKHGNVGYEDVKKNYTVNSQLKNWFTLFLGVTN